jgi:hypothetical protein
MSETMRQELIDVMARAFTEGQVGRLDMLDERRTDIRVAARRPAAEKALDAVVTHLDAAYPDWDGVAVNVRQLVALLRDGVSE